MEPESNKDKLSYSFQEYDSMPRDYIEHMKQEAKRSLLRNISEMIELDRYYTIKFADWRVRADYLSADEVERIYTLQAKIVPVLTEKSVIRYAVYEDMDWDELSKTALGEMKRRWAYRLSSVRRFFDWLERAMEMRM